jgi:hypothetical protein
MRKSEKLGFYSLDAKQFVNHRKPERDEKVARSACEFRRFMAARAQGRAIAG